MVIRHTHWKLDEYIIWKLRNWKFTGNIFLTSINGKSRNSRHLNYSSQIHDICQMWYTRANGVDPEGSSWLEANTETDDTCWHPTSQEMFSNILITLKVIMNPYPAVASNTSHCSRIIYIWYNLMHITSLGLCANSPQQCNQY